jgi:hypothetical protein
MITNLPESVLAMIIMVHFLADFGLQTHDQATGKGANQFPDKPFYYNIWNKWLFYHVGVYSLTWLLFCLGTTGITGFSTADCFTFAGVTFVAHYATDWLTSRIGKPFWAKQDFHNGFTVVGYDQIFHYFQLYYTFKILMHG